MKSTIISQLQKTAQENNIELLLAIESGSRAWGFASPDSDYDIRFVYRHPKDWYLNLWEEKDNIQFMTENDLDGSGWELQKSLKLLAKSNAPLLEWLHSPITYFQNETFLKEMKELTAQFFSPISTTYHYLNMSHKYLAVCSNSEKARLKDYCYTLRTLCCCLWILRNSSFPQVDFNQLYPEVIDDKNIMNEIKALLNLKSTSKEKMGAYRNPLLLDFMKMELQNIEAQVQKLPMANGNRAELNKMFKKLVS